MPVRFRISTDRYNSIRIIRVAIRARIIYYRLKDWDKSIADFSRTIAFNDDLLGEAYLNRSICYFEKGDIDNALTDSLRGLEIRPDALEYNNHGYYLLIKGRYDEALPYIQKSLELNPNLAATWDTRGWYYFNVGNYNQAIEDLTRAINLDTEDSLIYSHRGASIYYVKEYDKAMIDLNKAVELNEKECRRALLQGLMLKGSETK